MQGEGSRRSYHDIPLDIQLTEFEKKSSHSSPNDPVSQKVEMMSVSTTSLPMSFPHYVIDDINTFHTDNVDSAESSGSAYTMTSPTKGARRAKDQRGGDNGNDNAMSSHVPKRFSHFVVDQQNPYLAQRLDNLSFDSASLESMVPKRQPSGRQSITTRGSKSSKSSYPLTKETSHSMESQATIFSTRPEKNEEYEGLTSRRNRTRTKSQRSAKPLSRRKAIRFKSGSIIYRIQIRMKRILAKLKRSRFIFSASSKFKKTTRRRHSFKRQKSKKLYRKDWGSVRSERGQRHAARISAPSTNPEVGYGRVDRIRGLDDEVKYYAGAPRENVNLPDIYTDIKRDQMSGYLGEQQKTFLNNLWSKSSISSINYPRSSLDVNSNYRMMIGTAVTDEIEDSMSIPPPPPPHFHTPNDSYQPYNNFETMRLWKSYLCSVLSKRIQLRQEINLFQSFLASGQFSNFDASKYPIALNASNRSMIASSEQESYETVSETVSSYLSSTTSSQPRSSENDFRSESSDIFIDPPTEEFNKRYLNRRSILGEMLDYSSASESSSSIFGSDNKETSSDDFKMNQDISMGRMYGMSRNGSKLSTKVI